MDVRWNGAGELVITFYEDGSEFDGNDFDYTFRFDPENTEALLALMGTGRSTGSIRDWLDANVEDQKSGFDFRRYCIDHHISGTRTVHEDYPGGIYREEAF